MFEPVRWTTLHPALVHLPLGVLPFMVIAYAGSALRRSERWAFVGDLSAGFSVFATFVAALFGWVAFLSVDWPGGLGPWPVVHLVSGTVTTLALIAFAWLRVRARRRDPIAGPVWAFTSAAVTLVAIATGYVGGEVLVFHGGIAVEAAGHGALAPGLTRPEASPSSVHVAMERIRPPWASVTTTAAQALVTRPTADHFARMESEAQQLQRLARWLVDWGGDAGQGQNSDTQAEASDSSAQLREMARPLLDGTQRLGHAAAQQDLAAVMQALGETSQACASCHMHLRWEDEHPSALAQ